ncbi:MAG TPA: ABC transporter substrate-binding protein [Bryobacteraceae bacterium]|nr:ABC transporter substrate-binding protein [Bryobacteraceae bacterium]
MTARHVPGCVIAISGGLSGCRALASRAAGQWPAVITALLFSACCCWSASRPVEPVAGGELRFCLRAEPRTFDPLMAAEEPDEIVSFLTGGVLIRMNRLTQAFEPELAESWRLSDAGRKIEFKLREGVRFSDGAVLTAADVLYTLRTVLDPARHSPVGDPFRNGSGAVAVSERPGGRIVVAFSAPAAGVERLFDQLVITSARSREKLARPAEMPVLGPYRIAEYQAGSYILLVRNPQYWKKDAAGQRLPYIDSIRLSIQQNRELELIRFLRGQIDLINGMDAESFDRLAAKQPAVARDAGRSLEGEQLWFNQVARSPIPECRKEWFRSRDFRRAISQAINRADLARVVYRGRAAPAIGPVSPANLFWSNAQLPAPAFDPKAALARLAAGGFALSGDTLRDRGGHAVEFSLITNSGNQSRVRVASMIQQDLARIGIRLNIVTLDFGSLIERITRNFNYESCLLGLVNVDLDPSAQMNVWLSSAANHPWNPGQPAPQTAWEAEIDSLMRAQAVEPSPVRRKTLFDRVQAVVLDQAPVLYLVDKDSLSAVSGSLGNVAPAVLHPQTFWNVERLYFRDAKGTRH